MYRGLLLQDICTITIQSFFPSKGNANRLLSLTCIYSFVHCSDDYALLATQDILLPVLKLEYSNSVHYVREEVTQFIQVIPEWRESLDRNSTCAANYICNGDFCAAKCTCQVIGNILYVT